MTQRICGNPNCTTIYCRGCKGMQIIVGICREDNPHDVDEAYGEGTYARMFPESDDECPDCHEAIISNEHNCEPESDMEREIRG